MALINCPECNREISDTSSKCIHCGYRIKNKRWKKVIVLLIVLVMAIIAIGLLVKRFCLPDTPFPTLFKLMECQQPEEIKDILGENFTRYEIREGVFSERYDNIQIDGLDFDFFTIDYENGSYTGIFYETLNVDNSIKDTIFETLVAQYGDIQSYSEEELNNNKVDHYQWNNESKNLLVGIIPSSEDVVGMYRIQGVVVWK